MVRRHDLKLLHSKLFCLLCSELPAAAARPEPARRYHQVRIHGQEGDQQTAQTEGEEERVGGRVEGASERRTTTRIGTWKEVV